MKVRLVLPQLEINANKESLLLDLFIWQKKRKIKIRINLNTSWNN